MSYFDPNAPDIVLKSLFAKYDKDSSGYLQRDEIIQMLRQDMGMNKNQAESFSLLLDKDGDQRISWGEFLAWIRSDQRFSMIDDSSRYYYLRKAVELFKKYDKDGSGVLERNEVDSLLLSLGCQPEKLEAGFKSLDTNGQGTVSFPEFLKYLNWLPMDM